MTEVFSGIRTIFKSPIKDYSKKYSVFGIPYDKTSTFRVGSRFGPSSIREASIMLCDGTDNKTNIDVQSLVSDFGDIDFNIENNELCNFDVKNPILLGGEHSITYMGLQNSFTRYGKVNVLHFDAHCDVWETKEVEHGSFLRHAIDDGFVNNVFQYGIRSPSPNEVKSWKFDDCIFDGHKYKIKNFVNPEEKWYVTIDIDCFDPCYAPGTGTPESFGLTPKFVLKKLEKFIKLFFGNTHNIVGFDVVEVNPAYDNNQITSILASNLIWKYIAFKEYYR